MAGGEQGNFRPEREVEKQPLDRGAVLDKLLDEVAAECGIDVAPEDVEWLRDETLAGEDDEDFLAYLISLAAENGIDHEEFLDKLGVPLELEQDTE